MATTEYPEYENQMRARIRELIQIHTCNDTTFEHLSKLIAGSIDVVIRQEIREAILSGAINLDINWRLQPRKK